MKREPIALSEHFDYKKLFRFVLPSVVMAVFTQVYGVVDGLFVSNFVGKAAFTSVNLMMPVLIILGAIGLMFGGRQRAHFQNAGRGRQGARKRLFFPVRRHRRFGIGVYRNRLSLSCPYRADVRRFGRNGSRLPRVCGRTVCVANGAHAAIRLSELLYYGGKI